jgi:hypothetical protein
MSYHDLADRNDFSSMTETPMKECRSQLKREISSLNNLKVFNLPVTISDAFSDMLFGEHEQRPATSGVKIEVIDDDDDENDNETMLEKNQTTIEQNNFVETRRTPTLKSVKKSSSKIPVLKKHQSSVKKTVDSDSDSQRSKDSEDNEDSQRPLSSNNHSYPQPETIFQGKDPQFCSLQNYLTNFIKTFNKMKQTKSALDLNIFFLQHFSFVKEVSRNGVQGVVGLFEFRSNKFSSDIVFKISKRLDFTIRRESEIFQEINKLRPYCPHFCYSFGWLTVPVVAYPSMKELVKFRQYFEPTKKLYPEMISHRKIDPFVNCSINDILYKIDIMFVEDLQGCPTFAKQMPMMKKNQNLSIIKQVLCAINTAQRIGFTHYDLHSENILLKMCDPRIVNVYIFGDKIYPVPTYGFCPMIIDFGVSYTQACKKLYGSLQHTNYGFFYPTSDIFADIQRFLISVGNDLILCGDEYRNFYNWVKRLFETVNMSANTQFSICTQRHVSN